MPLPGFQDRAARGMWTTAQNLESANDVENALNAYRSLRGAFFSLRSIVTPGCGWQAWLILDEGNVTEDTLIPAAKMLKNFN